MAIKLSKGQKIDLTKSNPLLNKVLVGLGWKAGSNVDLDTAAFLLRADGRVESDEDFVFYGNLRHKSGAVEHSGDNTTGGYGDAEQIHIDLKRMPEYIAKIDFTATIYDAQSRRQNFDMVHEAYIRVVDESSEQELLRFDLGENFSVETAIVVGEIYRHKGNWKFNATGAGFSGGLAALCNNFGVDVSSDNQNASSASPTAASKMPSEIVMQKWEQIELAKSGETYASIIFEFDAKTSNYCSNPPRFYCVYDAETSWGDRMTHFMPEDNDLGFFNRAPYIAKDSGRDIIRLNGKFADKFNHIVICVDKVYNDWIEMNGVLRIKCPGNPDLVINLDESNKEYRCVLAAIDNIGGTFKVEKIVKFYADDDGIINDFFSDIAR